MRFFRANVAKPDWDWQTINEKHKRWTELIHITESHEHGCACNECMEEYSLDNLLGTFSEDEMASAVIEAHKAAKLNQGEKANV